MPPACNEVAEVKHNPMSIDSIIERLTRLREKRERIYGLYESLRRGDADVIIEPGGYYSWYEVSRMVAEEDYDGFLGGIFNRYKQLDDIVKMIEETKDVSILKRLEL